MIAHTLETLCANISYLEREVMGNFDKIVRGIDNGIEKVVEGLVCIVLGVDLVLILIEIITRYFFAMSRSYMEELPKYSLPVITFLMMGILLKRGSHVAVEILPERLKNRAKAAAGLRGVINLDRKSVV